MCAVRRRRGRASRGPAPLPRSRPSTRGDDCSGTAVVRPYRLRRPARRSTNHNSDYLRLGTRAFLAGDHASARAVFEALLLPVAQGDISLGQHEMVEEVLNVDMHVTVAQYVASVYTTTPLVGRANALSSSPARRAMGLRKFWQVTAGRLSLVYELGR